MTNINTLVDQVLAIDSSKSRADIIMDLRHTKNVEATINRIFDGHFLNGTERDPSKSAFLILDSDDDDNNDNNNDESDGFEISREASPVASRNTITVQDSLEEISFDTSSKHDRVPKTKAKTKAPAKKNKALDNFSTPSPVDTAEPFSIIEDDDAKDNQSSSPQLFLSLDDDDDKEITQASSTPREKPKPDSIFGTHFDDIDDPLDALPSATDFFDDLLQQKPATPVVELDDDDDDAIEIVSPIQDPKDRKGKRRAFDFEVPIRNNRRRLDEDIIPDFETAAERKEREKEEKKRKREQDLEEKRQKKAEKLEEKKREKQQKQLEKERKTLFEKENRIRADRNEILKEIIVDIHPDFLKTKPGQLIELVLTRKEAEVQDLLLLNPSPSYTLSWRRKTNSEWDHSSQAFIPISATKIVQEPIVLVYVDIPDFTKRIQNKTIDRYIDIIERDCDGRQIFLLIEGLEVYFKKKLLLKRRQFESQVRNTFNGAEGSTTAAARKNNLANYEDGLDPNDVEECLNYLQLTRGVMLVPTKDDEDTASWIESLTTDLALGRYKSKNINNSYKVGKSGTDPKDTYLKMLQEVQLCTPAIANSVAGTYPTLQSLSQAYQRKDVAHGELLLSDLDVERSALTSRDRKINRVMSKKIYTIFNSDDPEQIIY